MLVSAFSLLSSFVKKKNIIITKPYFVTTSILSVAEKSVNRQSTLKATLASISVAEKSVNRQSTLKATLASISVAEKR